MNFFKGVSLFLFCSIVCYGQDKVLKVWPNGAPTSYKVHEPEIVDEWKCVRNVSEAEIFVYVPENESNTGAAVVICPGGGYQIEAIEHEGIKIAEWLTGMGITGIVLKYRLPEGHHEIPADDACQAIRIVRKNAKKWGINPSRIGIAGSSAGGHLAATVGTLFSDKDKKNKELKRTAISCKPDFMLLLYPVISFKEKYGHKGTIINLIGKEKKSELVEYYSNELNVSDETPPAFIVLADDDKAVSSQNSIMFYLAMKKYKILAEIHVFARGGHGFGMNKRGMPVDGWPELFYNWLKSMKFIN